MRRQDNQRENGRFSSGSPRNNDWNRTSEHFSSDRSDRSDRMDRFDRNERDLDRMNTDYDMARNSRTDEYDRYAYNNNNNRGSNYNRGYGHDYASQGDGYGASDSRSSRYRESDSWDSGRDASTSGRSFYSNNQGTFGMNSSQSGARNFDNNRYGNSSYDNYSNHSFGQNDFRNTSDRSGHYGKGPKGWKRSDERLKEEVCEVLFRDQHLDATNIEVSVQDGNVTLSGTIDSRFGKRHAEECIEHLSGVEDIRNEIKISKTEGQSSSTSSSSTKEPLRKLS